MANKPTLLCKGTGCALKYTCKCYLEHKEVQKNGTDGNDVSYFGDVPYEFESNTCFFYWPER